MDYSDDAQAEAYWNFSWGDMYKDVIANGQAMSDNFAGSELGIYIGYSQGTIQMISGLTLAESEITAHF